MRMASMAVAVLASIVSLSSIFGADDPFLGTWKLNVDKSRSPAVMQSQLDQSDVGGPQAVSQC